MKTGFYVESLLSYAERHLGLKELDKLCARNALMEIFSLDDVSCERFEDEALADLAVPDTLLAPLGEYALKNNLAEEFTLANFYAKLMGFLTPQPSVVADMFWDLYKNQGPKQATDYLYNLSVKNNYIQKTAIEKNLFWQTDKAHKDIEITVNLSKPEKSNEETAKILSMPQSGYPKCVLCRENLGFFGNYRQGARQNLRFVPFTLGGTPWYMQYSPYLYYDEHCIVFSKAHSPMIIDETTFGKLFDFVEQLPDYFLGCNAALPGVGGSVLNHEHFQGGKYVLPLQKAALKKAYKHADFDGVRIGVVDWDNNVLRISGKVRKDVERLAVHIFNIWQGYSDEKIGLIAKTDKAHNAIAPVARFKDGEYILDIILRNNRANEEHPDGIFHAHKEYHHIKKESIGLIEASGLFILPGRLAKEKIDRTVINDVCQNILKNTAVFKEDDAEGLQRFTDKLNFKEIKA